MQELIDWLTQRLEADVSLEAVPNTTPPTIRVSATHIATVCQILRDHEKTYFDYLACITALDNGPEKGTLEVLYHLHSIPHHTSLALQVIVSRNLPNAPHTEVPSVCHLWRAADWHEREAYDLVGIHFVGHPDLRRIFLPADWQGHPLRKDYQVQEQYHGVNFNDIDPPFQFYLTPPLGFSIFAS